MLYMCILLRFYRCVVVSEMHFSFYSQVECYCHFITIIILRLSTNENFLFQFKLVISFIICTVIDNRKSIALKVLSGLSLTLVWIYNLVLILLSVQWVSYLFWMKSVGFLKLLTKVMLKNFIESMLRTINMENLTSVPKQILL